ncbi:hypothetical protein KVM30_06535 [Helicobacter pylori]|nr:hypothetical protein KVM30_06535 [Helicobacter pylori]
MRQEHETATNFNELKAITQAIQALKNGTPKNATNQESERTQAKKGRLNPTKKAFSERQMTAFRDNSQASEEKRLKTEQGNQQGDNANAFKSDEKNTREK